ncbi:predicted protein [Botrytis cinerea T4]|uniref:Uncharacterized protein n=1 Tax=Botryotinia fuckeliana (strain T4) TaxID=999810 RepID=G2XP18_BOTF4|nr:predicted protein [Botrytis cinerea T4]
MKYADGHEICDLSKELNKCPYRKQQVSRHGFTFRNKMIEWVLESILEDPMILQE